MLHARTHGSYAVICLLLLRKHIRRHICIMATSRQPQKARPHRAAHQTPGPPELHLRLLAGPREPERLALRDAVKVAPTKGMGELLARAVCLLLCHQVVHCGDLDAANTSGTGAR